MNCSHGRPYEMKCYQCVSEGLARAKEHREAFQNSQWQMTKLIPGMVSEFQENLQKDLDNIQGLS